MFCLSRVMRYFIYNILLTFSWICAASAQRVKYALLVLWHLVIAMVVNHIYGLPDSCVCVATTCRYLENYRKSLGFLTKLIAGYF